MDIVPTWRSFTPRRSGVSSTKGWPAPTPSTQSQGWDAQAGWVGLSGAALSGLLDRWQSHAGAHHRMLNDHHHALETAATMFLEMDEHNAQRLKLVS